MSSERTAKKKGSRLFDEAMEFSADKAPAVR